MGLGRSQATELHGAYCGGHGTPFCPKDRRITTTPFEFKMPKVIAARRVGRIGRPLNAGVLIANISSSVGSEG